MISYFLSIILEQTCRKEDENDDSYYRRLYRSSNLS
jgi:hypothetical protein